MKATGVVRRIDDLGRIVVPKEIRRTLRIREGAPLLTSLIHSQDLPDTAENQGLKTRLFMEGISRVAGRVMG